MSVIFGPMVVHRATSTVDDLRPGAIVGEYRIDSKLAEGGMGSIYSATHPVIGRRAAVKVLLKALCKNQEAVARFVDEARAVNQIGHKNIVDVFAFGALPDGRSYFVMEWLEGYTLGELIATRTLYPTDAIKILIQLCDALEAAHRAGVLHRDIKADNVILLPDEGGFFVKLLDFGIAKLGEYTHESERNSVVGTPSYLSPEQAQAQAVDHRTDIYSLGVLAYEMLTGSLPFRAASATELLLAHIHRDPPSPRTQNPEISPVLEAAIMTMLSKDREKRPDLDTVRNVLSEELTARRLSDIAPQQKNRPYVRRRFQRVADLAHPLMTELSAGVAWIRARGDAPPVGTPVAIRFEVEPLAARIDFGAIVTRHFGAPATKVLVRYDQVDKKTLDPIFAVLAGARSQSPSAETAEDAIWQAPGDTGRLIPPVEVDVVAKQIEATGDLAPAPRRGLGVRGKVAALTALVAALAVGATTLIALSRARVDRTFYARDLTVRTAQLLAQSYADRVAGFEQRLTVAALGGDDGKVELGPFRTLSICTAPLSARRCQQAAGEAPKDEMIQLVSSRLPDGFVVAGFEGGIVAAKKGGKNKIAIATAPRTALAKLDRIPAALSVALLDEKHDVLVSRGDAQTSFSAVDLKGPSGAREFEAADGTKMYGAYARAGSRVAVVAAPLSLSAEQTSVLTQQVLMVAAAVIVLALIAAFVLAARTTKKLRTLATHAARIARGDFTGTGLGGGGDEVGHLGESLDAMARSLRQRDEDVLRIQRKMSEDQTQAMQRHMSEWLETDLASRLTQIRKLAEDPAALGRDRALSVLAAQASASLEHALALAVMTSRRVDIASTVADAVAYARTALHGSGVTVDLSAPNAVMFPRVDARESEVRELVQTMVMQSGRVMRHVGVSLTLDGGRLSLAVDAPNEAAAKETIAAIDDIVARHEASVRVVSGAGYSMVVDFPVPKEAE